MLFEIAPGYYAMASEGFDKATSEDDPGVATILWSRSRAVALTGYDRKASMI
ncbi:hypothetical protein [Actinoplanes sp. TFC3]|uniref:hypothetical protein n=1 Tax=Actinoplanes sp. TFC3 TaxID=1710355 RepID=UPI000A6D5784|nr:hypothetical protein [Actinoplanes sp. TFC3]